MGPFVFQNPWGLLALLSIPAIMALYFFHSQRRERRVGGLHLWGLDKRTQPRGARLTRFHSRLSLLFQIIAAIALTLLIAGLDMPKEDTSRHYAILLDDSASMTADQNAPAKKARQFLQKWANPNDRFTLIAVGPNPSVKAGPFAEKDALLQAIQKWNPQAPTADFPKAWSFAARFLAQGGTAFAITDTPQNQTTKANLPFLATGKPLQNHGFVFADRIIKNEQTQMIFAKIRAWSPQAETRTLKAFLGQTPILNQQIQINPGKETTIQFETTNTTDPIRLQLPPDTLHQDNTAWLPAPSPPTVHAAAIGFGTETQWFQRAWSALTYTQKANRASQAHLIFLAGAHFPLPDSRQYPNASIICILPEKDNTTSITLSRNISRVPLKENPIKNLPLQGALWPYEPQEIQTGQPWLTCGEIPLIASWKDSRNVEQFWINLYPGKGNLTQTPTWPVLINLLTEHCRKSLPGLTRSSFRLGEPANLTAAALQKGPQEITLTRNGQTYGTYQNPTELATALSALPLGLYRINGLQTGTTLQFAINFFHPLESDLQSAGQQELQLNDLASAPLARVQSAVWLYYLLLAIFLASLAAAWYFLQREPTGGRS